VERKIRLTARVVARVERGSPRESRCRYNQENQQNDTKFQRKTRDLGYESATRPGQWNGVAILSKLGIETSRADSVTTIRARIIARGPCRRPSRGVGYVPKASRSQPALRVPNSSGREAARLVRRAPDANQPLSRWRFQRTPTDFDGYEPVAVTARRT